MTTLFPTPVFGPVHSRRLGISLGVNLLPAHGKVCSFDCIYCECGYNGPLAQHEKLPTRQQVSEALERQLQAMADEGTHPDVITFAGNGEPTMHPQFAEIVDDTIRLRDRWCAQAKISVLSNATQVFRPAVFEALKRVDNNILKLDTVSMDYIRRVDRPRSPRYDAEAVIRQMAAFEGHCIVQTIFLKGTHEGASVANTDPAFVTPWIDALRRIGPEAVMVYTIDRDTPSPLLQKASPEELDAIADRVRAAGFACQVSY